MKQSFFAFAAAAAVILCLAAPVRADQDPLFDGPSAATTATDSGSRSAADGGGHSALEKVTHNGPAMALLGAATGAAIGFWLLPGLGAIPGAMIGGAAGAYFGGDKNVGIGLAGGAAGWMLGGFLVGGPIGMGVGALAGAGLALLAKSFF